MASLSEQAPLLPGTISARFNAWLCGVLGCVVLAACGACALSLLSWQIADPSLTHAASGPVRNLLGPVGAIISDLIMQLLGLAGVFVFLPPVFWALQLIGKGRLDNTRVKFMLAPIAVLLLACAASSLPRMGGWPLPYNIGGALGDTLLRTVTSILAMIRPERASAAAGLFCFAGGLMLLMTSLGLSQRDLKLICQRPRGLNLRFVSRAWQKLGEMSERAIIIRREPTLGMPAPHSGMGLAARGGFVPYPSGRTRGHPYAPQDQGIPDATGDDDIDPRELKRIASICAPDRSSKSAAVNGAPSILIRPGRAEKPYPSTSADPIQAAWGVMTAPGDRLPNQRRDEGTNPGAAWPVPAPVAPMAPRVPMSPPTDGWRPQSMPGGDDLYGRAVAIVLDDRKASAGYLQQRLAIGYMRAADLIERMEREGILGAPVYNGMRPILIGGPGSREI
jgi:DNA translocase FtsK/SpoIIIE-like protein